MPVIPRKYPYNELYDSTTASGNNTDTYTAEWALDVHRGAIFYITRTADGGVCTLDVYLQGHVAGTTSTFMDLTLGIIPQFADGETGTYAAVVYPGITAQDTSLDAITTTTALKVSQTSTVMPRRGRLRIRSGGTGVTNTLSITMEVLP